MTEIIPVFPVAEIGIGEIRKATIRNGIAVALYNVDGCIFATADACTHGGASLSEDGYLNGCIVECSWHYGSFDVTTGAPCASPCTIPLQKYSVQIIDGIVHIEWHQESEGDVPRVSPVALTNDNYDQETDAK